MGFSEGVLSWPYLGAFFVKDMTCEEWNCSFMNLGEARGTDEESFYTTPKRL